jgi:hypothetical protein
MKNLASAKTVEAALKRVRALCLALPGAEERQSHAFPTFFVGKKVFCYFSFNHHGDGRLGVLLKTGLEMQDLLVNQDAERFYKPAYVAHQGFTGIRLEGRAPWGLVEDLVTKAWEQAASPKRGKAAR